jgi:type II secretory pathway pseudopilin PulG
MVIKKLQRLKAKKALTLVEVVIGLAIFTMLVAAVFSMYQPVLDVANLVRNDTDMQRVVSAGEQFVLQQLRSSPEIHIFHEGGATISNTTASRMRRILLNMKPEDLPQLMALRAPGAADGGGRIFNARISDLAGTSPVGGGATSATLNGRLNAGSRVFNEAFYNGVQLGFRMEVVEPNPWQQVRGNTHLLLQTDAFRDGDINLDSRSFTDTPLTWIGNVGTEGDNMITVPAAALRATTHSSASAGGGDTIFILYLGNIDFTSTPEVLACPLCNSPGACDCCFDCESINCVCYCGGCGSLVANCSCDCPGGCGEIVSNCSC